MSKNRVKDEDLKRIKTGVRSLRLLGVGVKSGLRAASLMVGAAVGKRDKEAVYRETLRSAVDFFVKEVGQMKGGVMKAGQMLSVYGEHFLPEDINRVLKSLQADSPPVSFTVMKKKIRRALGEDIFAKAHIDPVPIGSASLGQVYRMSIVWQGEELDVALKVQYPKVGKAICADLNALRRLLSMTKIMGDMDRFDEVFSEIKSMLMREANYTKELAALQFYQHLLKDDKVFRVPAVYGDFSTKTVLAMGYMPGRRLDDPCVRELSQQRRNRLGLALIRLLFEEIFVYRQVQTDPHVGNFVVQIKEDGFEQDRIVLLDFGAVRKLGKVYVENFRCLALACFYKDKDMIIRYGIKMGFLRLEDTVAMKDLFVRIVIQATLPFSEEYAGKCLQDGSCASHEYDWSSSTVVGELSKLARDAVFSFRLRPPPKEAVFVDRKLVGTVTLLKILAAKIGPRSLGLEYLQHQSLPKNDSVKPVTTDQVS
ncbi:MAG: AarF/ABC1/UbiB kinase family protein [Proteobacteria bacterium]|nr:AarF/ABC1/UbiB kinase family protein [Pseudomonadota bacterium]